MHGSRAVATMAAATGLAIFALAGGSAQAQDAGTEAPRIVVQGEGEASAAPDMATLQMGVSARADGAAEAMAQVRSAMADLLAELADAGVEERDVQTGLLNLRPLFSDDPNAPGPGPDPEGPQQGGPRILGYAAESRVTVRVRDLQALGPLTELALSQGVNGFQGVGFGLADDTALSAEARRMAVADARARAEAFAEAAGVELGPLMRLTDQGGGRPVPMMRMEAASMRDGSGIAGGEVTANANVTLEYGIAR